MVSADIVDGAKIYFLKDGSDGVEVECVVCYYLIHPLYITNDYEHGWRENINYDLALLMFFAKTEELPFVEGMIVHQIPFKANLKVDVYGYPNNSLQLKYNPGIITGVAENPADPNYNFWIYSVVTDRGMSGGPVIAKERGKSFLIGVHLRKVKNDPILKNGLQITTESCLWIQ